QDLRHAAHLDLAGDQRAGHGDDHLDDLAAADRRICGPPIQPRPVTTPGRIRAKLGRYRIMKFGSDKKYERLLEAYGNGDVSRRDMMRLLTVAAAAVGVVGGPFGKLTREALAAVEQVRFDGWGG